MRDGRRGSRDESRDGEGASPGGRRCRRVARAWAAGAVLSIVLAGSGGPPALADDYDAQDAGHPVRIVAYVLHPVGVALDYLLMRPAHWIVSHEPFKTLFGHED